MSSQKRSSGKGCEEKSHQNTLQPKKRRQGGWVSKSMANSSSRRKRKGRRVMLPLPPIQSLLCTDICWYWRNTSLPALEMFPDTAHPNVSLEFCIALFYVQSGTDAVASFFLMIKEFSIDPLSPFKCMGHYTPLIKRNGDIAIIRRNTSRLLLGSVLMVWRDEPVAYGGHT